MTSIHQEDHVHQSTIPQTIDFRHVDNSEAPATIKNRYIDRLIEDINTIHGVDQNLVVSARKDSLSQIPMNEFLEITDILYHNHHPFTEKRMVPKLTKNLNIESITSLLDSLQEVYSTTTTNGKDKETLFEENKNAVQKKIEFLDNKGLIHNRLLFWLFLAINYEKKIADLSEGQMNKFHANDFLKNINNRLFLDENKELFWQKITTQGRDHVHKKTSEALQNSLEQ